ncbi:MAG: hypothetical protein HY720_30070 [Planctomycetes bacterium]|nr:hypothetical protein [Planctomycetota bacterium]
MDGLFLVIVLSGCRASEDLPAKKNEVYADYSSRDGGFDRLAPPAPDEWLALVDEPGQTFEEFKRTASNQRSAGRDTIYLLPAEGLSRRNPELLETVREYVSVFFQCAASFLPDRPLPRSAWSPDRQQYDAEAILDDLAAAVPSDALAVAAFTDRDLYSGRLNFVFGLASLTRRVGVYSIHRYGDPHSREGLRRTLKVANHEIGHMFGIRHCVFYRCSMNGSNSLAESDARPIHYCPPDLDKLVRAVGCDPASRARDLASFYRRIGFLDDARFLEGRLP